MEIAMNTESIVIERLQALEKQNRQMKRIGAAVILIAVSLLLMGQTSPNRTVEAQVFKLIDKSGKVRAMWAVDDIDGAPKFALLGADGTMRAMLGLGNHDTPQLSLVNPPQGIDIWIPTQISSDGHKPEGGLMSVLEFKTGQKTQMNLQAQRYGGVTLNMEGSFPSISLLDNNNFEARLGKAQLTTTRTGESSQTSAASLVLSDKDGKIIWKAP